MERMKERINEIFKEYDAIIQQEMSGCDVALKYSVRSRLKRCNDAVITAIESNEYRNPPRSEFMEDIEKETRVEVPQYKKHKKSRFMEEWEITGEALSDLISDDAEQLGWRMNKLAELIDKHKADK